VSADATTAADAGTPRRWLNRAGRISDAYGLVLLLTLVTFLFTSLLPTTDWSRAFGVALSGITSIIGLTSSQVSPQRVRRAAVLVLLSVVLALASASTHTDAMMAAAQTITAGLLLITAGTILKRVLTSSSVTFRTILGALTTYTMFGLLFSYVYAATGVIQGTPFFGNGTHKASGDFLFFSYTTLTTTGYGDLVPAGQPGKSFAVFEMLLGQIFLVTLVAGLVSLWRPGQRYETAAQRDRGPGHDA
jgi:hypothetical protein